VPSFALQVQFASLEQSVQAHSAPHGQAHTDEVSSAPLAWLQANPPPIANAPIMMIQRYFFMVDSPC
jgi:hypothetical protein